MSYIRKSKQIKVKFYNKRKNQAHLLIWTPYLMIIASNANKMALCSIA